ncbi:ankyrin repeat protein [Seiridium cupressi]
MLTLLDLPNELLHQIVTVDDEIWNSAGFDYAHWLYKEKGPVANRIMRIADLSSLVRSCRRLNDVVEPVLYWRARDFLASGAVEFAARTGNIDTLNKALAYKLDITGAGSKFKYSSLYRTQKTPLALAARYGQVAAVSWFLDHGVYVDTPASPCGILSWHFTTPLFDAISGESVETAKLLIARGASVWKKSIRQYYWEDGYRATTRPGNALHDAAEWGLTELCEHLVCDIGLDVLEPDILGQDPLMLAVLGWAGPETLTRLVQLNAPVNGVAPAAWEFTPLARSIEQHKLTNATTLIDLGAHITPGSSHPWKPTPLQSCLIRDEEGYHRIQQVESDERIGFMNLLLRRGVDINDDNHPVYGTALRAAISSGMLPELKFLLESGADVNQVSGPHDTTALMEATRRTRRKTPYILRMLLRHGARIDVNAKEEELPVSLARQ